MLIRELIENYQPKPYGQQSEFAVFIPLMEIDGEDHLVYQVRSQTVSQPGETSFPGGFIEPGETIVQAAVREFEEEMGISQDHLMVYGQMDYIVSDHAIIHSVIGRIMDQSLDDFKVNEEVERVFTLPLSFLKAHPPKFYSLEMTVKENSTFPFHLLNQGVAYHFSHMNKQIPFYDLSHYNQEKLWGFTADFTSRFMDIIQL